jgi:hypothetical protein
LSPTDKTDSAAAFKPARHLPIVGSARAVWLLSCWAGRGRAEARHFARARPANLVLCRTTHRAQRNELKAAADRPYPLRVFYDYRRGATTRFAFKRSLVVLRKIRLDSSEPHRHVALSATRVFYFLFCIGRNNRDPRRFHRCLLLVLQACNRSLSHRRLRHTADGDAPDLGVCNVFRQ